MVRRIILAHVIPDHLEVANVVEWRLRESSDDRSQPARSGRGGSGARPRTQGGVYQHWEEERTLVPRRYLPRARRLRVAIANPMKRAASSSDKSESNCSTHGSRLRTLGA